MVDKMTTDIHNCSLYCDRPGCIKAQRDQMRDEFAHPQVPLTEEEIDGIYLEVVGPKGGKLSRAFARASIVCTRGIGEKK